MEKAIILVLLSMFVLASFLVAPGCGKGNAPVIVTIKGSKS